MNECLKRYFDNLSKEEVKDWLCVVKGNQEVAKKLFKFFSDEDFVFNLSQMKEIHYGLVNLNEQEIKLYANPKFNSSQMAEIRRGLQEEIDIEKVKKYAVKELSHKHMEIARIAIENKIDIDKMIQYIKEGFKPDQLYRILDAMLIHGGKDVDLVANKNYSAEYMKVICKYLNRDMDVDIIKKWIASNFTARQLDFVLETIYKYGLSDNKLKIFANPKYEVNQMEAIVDGLVGGLSIKAVKVYANPEFDSEQMSEIRSALQYSELSIEKIKPYIKSEFESEQMSIIFNGLREGLDVTSYALTCFDYEQMHWIYTGLSSGIDITLYAKSYYTSKQMEQIYVALKAGYDKEKLHIIANPDLSSIQMSLIRQIFKKYNDTEKVRSTLNSDITAEKLEMILKKGTFDKKVINEREELISLLS